MAQRTDPPTEPERAADTTDTPLRAREWDAGKTTRDRVYEVALQLHDPVTASDAAERADCSTDAARQHLDWLAEIGVVARDPGHPTTYRRNESYFEWRRVEELRREHDADELLDRLEGLSEEEQAYRERYDVAHPDDVDALAAADFDAAAADSADDSTDPDAADHDAVHAVWRDLTDWRTVRREIRLLERARRASTSESSRGTRTDG